MRLAVRRYPLYLLIFKHTEKKTHIAFAKQIADFVQGSGTFADGESHFKLKLKINSDQFWRYETASLSNEYSYFTYNFFMGVDPGKK